MTPDDFKRQAAEAAKGEKGGEKGKGKGKKRVEDGMSVQDKTKIKRMKGQSGEDHNGRVWKPQLYMDMRANYD